MKLRSRVGGVLSGEKAFQGGLLLLKGRLSVKGYQFFLY